MKEPRLHFHQEGPLCEAGQHAACPSVGDPWYDTEPEARSVWVCSCSCHVVAGAGRGAVAPEEMTLRELLWVGHAIPGDGHGRYGDDGELQCSSPDGLCDFRRDTVARIKEHIERRGWRLMCERGEPVGASPERGEPEKRTCSNPHQHPESDICWLCEDAPGRGRPSPVAPAETAAPESREEK